MGSGAGGNLPALLAAEKKGDLGGKICLAVSDRSNVGILDKARAAKIDTYIIGDGSGGRGRMTRLEEVALADKLREAEIDLIVMIGFIRILSHDFLQKFPDRVINIHPSLLPKYKGLSAWLQALEAGEKTAGTTVHLAAPQVDSGRILAQESVKIHPDDTGEELHDRIQAVENVLLPKTVAKYLQKLPH